jgi:hypothetical protein
MDMPFTRAQFFEAFAAYNEAIWPLQLVLNVVAVAMGVYLIRRPQRAGRTISLGLALLWLWLATGYHLAFFWAINPAAPVFAAVSLAAAAAFVWLGVYRSSLRFHAGLNAGKIAGLCMMAFSLAVYPVLGALLGDRYPAAPTFGLPCPTTIFTFGVLLMAARPVPGMLVIFPLAWAVIGSFAAFLLDVTQDLALVPTAAFGVHLLLERFAQSGGRRRQ